MAHLLEPTRAPEHRFAFIGVPHDAATSLGNPGGRFGPQALREALRGVFSWRLQNGRLADIDAGVIDLSAVEVADFGDVALSYHDTALTVEQTYAAVQRALAEGYTPLVAGGDHGITFPPVKALHDATPGNIGLIQLDAHCDLMDFSDRQGRFSGSSGMRRSVELERLAPANLVQVGLRGYATVEQFEIGQQLGVRRISATRFAELGARAAAEQALALASEGASAVYLTIDLDVINPGEAPGTGWPEPGGLSGQQVIDFVRAVAPRIAALDIAELNPVYDTPARTTALLAARIVLDFITTRVRAG
ncbi:MAG TPA: arginase family protein [Kouleothrix sp.]|uniref:arginase family protein n=1 Tax=Kouleothrix sp. TaxID=2779161 RepID=UPI002BDE233B|nr:arginase family protein [Kouleothrix sp.]HRC76980.1 arginase family protein [Kouleothrix sp.]